jgi:hypothetical protein
VFKEQKEEKDEEVGGKDWDCVDGFILISPM